MDDQVENLLAAFRRGQVNFNEITIKGARFQAHSLPFIGLNKACLLKADFRHAVLPGSSFAGSFLNQSNFEHANLLGADLSWADLTRANLGHALMAWATLVGTDLSSTNLIGASLPGADLRSANLRNANLSGANLKGANLSRANLFGARIDPGALADAILEHTVMPNGECCTQLCGDDQPPVSLANMASHSRVANTLSEQRSQQWAKVTAQKDQAAIPPVPEVAMTATDSPDKTRQQKPVRFRFSEQSGDLQLAIVPPLEE